MSIAVLDHDYVRFAVGRIIEDRFPKTWRLFHA